MRLHSLLIPRNKVEEAGWTCLKLRSVSNQGKVFAAKEECTLGGCTRFGPNTSSEWGEGAYCWHLGGGGSQVVWILDWLPRQSQCVSDTQPTSCSSCWEKRECTLGRNRTNLDSTVKASASSTLGPAPAPADRTLIATGHRKTSSHRVLALALLSPAQLQFYLQLSPNNVTAAKTPWKKTKHVLTLFFKMLFIYGHATQVVGS